MKKIILVILTTGILFGSATLFKGSHQSVTFNSEPEEVSVYLDGQFRCKTPCTVNLKKNKFKNAYFKKDGYKTQNIAIETSFDPIGILNFFWDSSTTDAITGSLWEYSPNNYMIELKKKQ